MNSVACVAPVVLCFIVMLAVDYWCMKRTRDAGDFIIGTRMFGPWTSAFACGATF
jgi:SSS family solute:Na+ symporter